MIGQRKSEFGSNPDPITSTDLLVATLQVSLKNTKRSTIVNAVSFLINDMVSSASVKKLADTPGLVYSVDGVSASSSLAVGVPGVAGMTAYLRDNYEHQLVDYTSIGAAASTAVINAFDVPSCLQGIDSCAESFVLTPVGASCVSSDESTLEVGRNNCQVTARNAGDAHVVATSGKFSARLNFRVWSVEQAKIVSDASELLRVKQPCETLIYQTTSVHAVATLRGPPGLPVVNDIDVTARAKFMVSGSAVSLSGNTVSVVRSVNEDTTASVTCEGCSNNIEVSVVYSRQVSIASLSAYVLTGVNMEVPNSHASAKDVFAMSPGRCCRSGWRQRVTRHI